VTLKLSIGELYQSYFYFYLFDAILFLIYSVMICYYAFIYSKSYIYIKTLLFVLYGKKPRATDGAKLAVGHYQKRLLNKATAMES